jgi:predicted O-methyltransferase YrrM
MVMAALGRGDVVGIDPYSAEAAVQTDDHDRGIDLIEWTRTVDWEAIYSEVCAAIEHWGLKDRCRLTRTRSEDAAADFAPESVDLLHVDGNHDRAAVTRDVELFLPKMQAGGLVVLNDVSWPSVRDTYERLLASHELVFQVVDRGDVWLGEDHANDFAVFRLTSK